ncbi:hypothetical protein QYQ98_07860 [Corynebacterium sp. P3-F1]|uniref:hypothetical protein n=1 Tax=Corynebacterium sp. P3-F1 TaxID=3059080 RepID=UPI00265CF951|nr:hypothetical protein [Corynebacterium sp. P3-F1]WKK60942.1 hypothetical protein QYQ98_07860 [Corynebacterium sp. P3-F1]
MNAERIAELTRPLTDFRVLSMKGATAHELSQYKALPGTLCYPTGDFTALPYHEKRYLLAYAAARSSTGSVLVARSAARIWNMWVIATSTETIELALKSGKASPSRANSERYTYRYGTLSDSDITTVHGVSVTSAIRTFVDIARYHGFAEGLVAADCLLNNGFTRNEIRQYIEAMGRKKGIATVRRCLEHAIDRSESPYESYARALLIEAGIDDITAQFQIGRFRPDLCIGGWLLIEIDGRKKYEGEDGQKLAYKDLMRQREIENQGYVFRRVSPEFLLKYPDKFVDDILMVIEARRRGPVERAQS